MAAEWVVRAGTLIGGGAAAALTGAALVWAMENQPYNIWGALFLIPLILLVDAFILRAVMRREEDPWFRRLLAAGFVAKVAGTFARYYFVYVVYGGSADAERYNTYAAIHYENWRDGNYDLKWTGIDGTHWMELATTAIYTVIGPSAMAAFFIFASMAFWGCYLLLLAFRTALPEGNDRRYALFVFLLPSVLFWPSSIGKESWLLLMIGVTALGAARYFRKADKGLLLMALGGLGTAVVRPHVSFLLFGSLFAAQFFRPLGTRARGIAAKVVGVAVLAVIGVILATQSAENLGINNVSITAVSDQMTYRGENTDQGGSAFDAKPITNPLMFPVALVTVLFRPFPFEARNIQLLVQALEGVVLMVIAYRNRMTLRHLPRLFRTTPYVTFVVVYTLGFVWAFSSIANFGILSRQRVLMIPLAVVLLCLPMQRPISRSTLPARRVPNAARR